MQIQNLITEFLVYIGSVRGLSAKTVRTYQQALMEFVCHVEIEEEEGGIWFNITPLRFKIASQSKKTVAKKISAVRSFVEFLKERKLKVFLRGDEPIKVPKSLPKPIPKKYIDQALEVADAQGKLLVLMIYGLGLRISELASIRKEDIRGEWVRVVGKGSKTREIPMIEALQKATKEYLKEFSPRVYLFEENGQKMSENQLRYRLGMLFEKIGVKATPHQLRHSFATDLLNGGARITDVSELLGHSSLSTTEIYTKLASSLKLKNYQKAHPLCQEDE